MSHSRQSVIFMNQTELGEHNKFLREQNNRENELKALKDQAYEVFTVLQKMKMLYVQNRAIDPEQPAPLLLENMEAVNALIDTIEFDLKSDATYWEKFSFREIKMYQECLGAVKETFLENPLDGYKKIADLHDELVSDKEKYPHLANDGRTLVKVAFGVVAVGMIIIITGMFLCAVSPVFAAIFMGAGLALVCGAPCVGDRSNERHRSWLLGTAGDNLSLPIRCLTNSFGLFPEVKKQLSMKHGEHMEQKADHCEPREVGRTFRYGVA